MRERKEERERERERERETETERERETERDRQRDAVSHAATVPFSNPFEIYTTTQRTTAYNALSQSFRKISISRQCGQSKLRAL